MRAFRAGTTERIGWRGHAIVPMRAAKGRRLRHAICHRSRHEESCGPPEIPTETPGAELLVMAVSAGRKFIIHSDPLLTLGVSSKFLTYFSEPLRIGSSLRFRIEIAPDFIDQNFL